MPPSHQPPSGGKGGKNVAKSSLFSKLGKQLVEMHNELKDAEVTYSNFGDLPGGIENGRAQLVDAHFGEFKDGANKGKLFFMAQGIVVAPKTVFDPALGEEVEIAGKYTKIGPEALCDTPQAQGKRKTVKDHMAWLYNELGKLGVNRAAMDPTKLETVLAALVKAGPHFKFRTWKPEAKPGDQRAPRVNHFWDGLVASNGEAEPELDDATPQADGDDDQPPDDTTTAQDQFDETNDLSGLAEKAEAGDVKARKELTDAAVAAGHSPDDVANANTWADVVEMINNPVEGGGDETPPDDEPAAPGWSVKDVAKLLVPKDAKDPRKGKKLVDVVLTKVDEEKGTCEVKDMTTNKVIKNVKLDDLKVPEE